MVPLETIAKACHEANRAYCEFLSDHSQVPWESAPQWQQDSAVLGVKNILANPNQTPQESHEKWWGLKETEGWKHGPVKDLEKKEHPCMLPYDRLPYEQRMKDHIFLGVAKTFLCLPEKDR